MRTIAVVLGDNDFGNTFLPLLESIKALITHRGEEYITPEFICDSIRAGIAYHYRAFQVGASRQGYFKTEEEFAATVKYLNEITIYFDAAAETDILNKDHDGGAWYLDLQTGRIDSY
jgi:hypothetical protein